MISERKKREESDWWKGFKEAERLQQKGYVFDKGSSNTEMFCFTLDIVPSGRITYHGRGNSGFLTGMLDYVEHRKLNKEIYND